VCWLPDRGGVRMAACSAEKVVCKLALLSAWSGAAGHTTTRTWRQLCVCLCVQEGNADAGRYQLETAISTYRNQTGLLGSDTVLAGYHLKLGR
jgi:hypothetical protein